MKKAPNPKIEELAREIYIERVAKMPIPNGFTDENIQARLEEQAFFSFEAAEVFAYSAECWSDD